MNANRSEVVRITVTMTVVCALAGAVLGAAFVATHRYREAADRRTERRAILELLQLDSAATVLEVRQFITADRSAVVYRSGPLGSAAEREIVFALDGRLIRAGVAAAVDPDDRPLVPLGRMFAASRAGAPAGFVVEGETRGYKNRIRFFVALTAGFDLAGVRVVEHEEDPGLGAEIATPAFQGQYLGRAAAGLEALDVTKDPMPEDWRAALATIGRTPLDAWREQYNGERPHSALGYLTPAAFAAACRVEPHSATLRGARRDEKEALESVAQ